MGGGSSGKLHRQGVDRTILGQCLVRVTNRNALK